MFEKFVQKDVFERRFNVDKVCVRMILAVVLQGNRKNPHIKFTLHTTMNANSLKFPIGHAFTIFLYMFIGYMF